MNKTQPSVSSQQAQRSFFRWMTAGVAALLFSATSLLAQQTGTVTGQVSDSTTGKYLEGAEVSINGTDLRTSTERNGTFSLRNVPAGSQTVAVNYPGLDTKEQSVEVVAGQAVSLPVALSSSEVITLGEFRVEGTKEGMSQAIALQKVAVQSKLVAAGDQFGSISEGNIGEYLKYLPGVGVDYNSNDARGISLRGLKTQFTIIAIDGTPMASAASGGTNRRFETEQVASNNVETTEVYKTLTPDLPADATGGFVNMVTKSAFDRQDVQRFNYDVSFIVPHTRLGDAFSKESGTWGKGKHFVTRPNLDVNYARRVNEKFGFNVSYRLSERYDDSPRAELTWLSALPSGGTLTAGGRPLSLEDPTLLTYNQNNEQKLTHRESFATKIDYFITDATKLTFAGQWNWYDLTFMQRATAFAFGTQNVDNLPGVDENRSASASGNRSIQNNINQRNKYGTTIHGNATLSHEFNANSKGWVTGYWSQANSIYRDHTKGFVGQAVAVLNAGGSNPSFEVSNVLNNPDRPSSSITGSPDIFDLANYTLSGGANTRIRPQKAQDTKAGVRADYKYSFDLSMPLSIQVGTAYDETGRGIVQQEFRLAIPSNTNAEAYKADYTFDYDFDFGRGEVLDLYRIYETFGTDLPSPNTWNVYRFDETNLSGYFRADFTPIKDLLLIGGVRWEEHELDAHGRNWASATSRDRPYSTKYDKIYPSISARYSPSRSWVVRAGASKTVGHPDYVDVLPILNIPDTGNANATFPDENLSPYYVTNYDASVEYYFAKTGVLQAAVFRKEIEGYITSVPLDPNSDADKIRAGIDPSRPVNSINMRTNGEDASLQGVELLYNQTLSFLPKPFNGLNIQANWTKIDIDSDDLNTRYGMETNAVTESFNFIVGYRVGKFSANVSTNWTDDTLIGVGSGHALMNSYKAPDWKMNISARYEISRRYIVYAEVSNLFSMREEYYKGSAAGGPDRNLESIELPFRYFSYGYPHVSVGIRGTF